MVGTAVLVAGTIVANTLWTAMHTADVSFEGSARMHNRESEMIKKLDQMAADMKLLKKHTKSN